MSRSHSPQRGLSAVAAGASGPLKLLFATGGATERTPLIWLGLGVKLADGENGAAKDGENDCTGSSGWTIISLGGWATGRRTGGMKEGAGFTVCCGSCWGIKSLGGWATGRRTGGMKDGAGFVGSDGSACCGPIKSRGGWATGRRTGGMKVPLLVTVLLLLLLVVVSLMVLDEEEDEVS